MLHELTAQCFAMETDAETGQSTFEEYTLAASTHAPNSSNKARMQLVGGAGL